MDRNKLVKWSVGAGLVFAVGMFMMAPEPPRTAPSGPLPADPKERAAARARDALARDKAAIAKLQESKPPEQKDTLLTRSQVVYCLAEEQRVEGAREILKDIRDQSDFNAMVKDYNARCSAYRYRVNDHDSAKREVNAVRGALRRQGVARFEVVSTTKPVETAK
jgi:hypothetical protein